jgi:peptidoglycan/xylan/chitin deacetylase (PgdA/CDA1 family)
MQCMGNMTNPIRIAFKAKGRFALVKRARIITRRYGLTSDLMDQALRRFSDVLQRYDCGATFPITAVTLRRHGDVVAKYLDRNIEFAVHGYAHVDYAHLAPEVQLDHLQRARAVFANAGITPMGFRSPYLRHESHLDAALEAAGFSYVSNQPILWGALDTQALSPASYASYERALAFYDPWKSSERLSLPRLGNKLVEIPVSLPDDEILIDRLGGSTSLVEKTWRRILSQTYQQGELFTLQLHPERIGLCVDGLSAVLSEARALTPVVWCARLDEIAAWWKVRTRAAIEVSKADDGGYHCVVSGPSGITVLVRAVDIDVPDLPWADGYWRVEATRFTIRSALRPLIGVSPSISIALIHFLRQQGYFVEISQESKLYTYYIDQVNFDCSQKREVLDHIEGSGCPLVRLGRWPNGAQSALCVTGDVDALTLWDYGLRLIGK